MSAIFDASSPYGGGGSSYDPYGPSSRSAATASSARGVGGGAGGLSNLQFYSQHSTASAAGAGGAGGHYTGSDGYNTGSNGRPSLEGNMTGAGGYEGAVGSHMMAGQMSFWSAFGTGGFPDEPGLMEELGINLTHVRSKALTVLNPFHNYSATHQRDVHMMDDADLAGPLMFCFAFGMLLLLAGKSQFGYIYGVGLMGDIAIYLLLNMMSEGGIDAYRVSSVLGYCLLPLCILSAVSIVIRLDGIFGYVLAPLFILWCSSSASGIFVSILRMSDQRFLVAYPVGLFYACFALLSVFDMDLSSSSGRRGS
ncbi:Yip1-domain-containing protein [Tilletiaria anomala UBC 951]|uniref:Protein YIP n=1 Tax=Tilletiaria anomala (strain ATCC 24038 / CBS 436.72 / UBC 951) TaxID=1037660 RepID=A0A066WGS1_TILAU|nr:Yip1-domain-containing protein [Tilletiaria anomala UBC 951]KDN53197.1 Yip1-domain-containing protein [Tilletiaria anomala UBC 951]